MKSMLKAIAAALCVALIGAVPAHVQTSDYWGGYAGTKSVPANVAARALTWAETDNIGSAQLAPLGVKTFLYSNPNRVLPRQAILYAPDPDDPRYAKTCSGAPARGEAAYAGILLTNPRSKALLAAWRRSNDAHSIGANFYAIFADEAVGAKLAQDVPCNYDLDDWIAAEAQLFRAIGKPIIYNALNDFRNQDVAPEISLNAAAIGGMMEECYATLREDHRVNGWRWIATENTEIRMAEANKYFFCYGRDLTPADQADDSRMYTYASFLLTYDPATTVLWEYYKTPSGGHVMPESQVVALDPVRKNVRSIADLHTLSGVYARAYRSCYIAGRPQGPCVAVVNPDDSPHAVGLRGYSRVLALHGSGIFDGGTVSLEAQTLSSLPPRGAVVAFR